MELQSGRYFGSGRTQWESDTVSLQLTAYEPLQSQPWHTHENPTLFVHLRGAHCDHWPQIQFSQPLLTAVFHPRSTSHRSEVGPNGMVGINVELKPAWMSRYETSNVDLGRERLLEQVGSHLVCLRLAVRAFVLGVPEDLESLVFELLTPCQPVRKAPCWLREAHERINGDVANIQGVAQLSSQIGIHPGHLSACYRKRYGTTVTQAIQQSRLALASRRMLEGASAGEAAAESGWADQFHLSRTMAQRMKLAPRDVLRLRNRLKPQLP